MCTTKSSVWDLGSGLPLNEICPCCLGSKPSKHISEVGPVVPERFRELLSQGFTLPLSPLTHPTLSSSFPLARASPSLCSWTCLSSGMYRATKIVSSECHTPENYLISWVHISVSISPDRSLQTHLFLKKHSISLWMEAMLTQEGAQLWNETVSVCTKTAREWMFPFLCDRQTFPEGRSLNWAPWAQCWLHAPFQRSSNTRIPLH